MAFQKFHKNTLQTSFQLDPMFCYQTAVPNAVKLKYFVWKMKFRSFPASLYCAQAYGIFEAVKATLYPV